MTFSNLPLANWERIQAKLREAGCEITGDKITTITPVQITFAYIYSDNQLTLTINDKPWMVPESMIWAEIEKVFKSL